MGGPYIGGNYYADRLGTGYSQACTDGDHDGICDSSNSFSVNNIDYLPLANPPIAIACGDTITTSTTLTNDLLDCVNYGLIVGASDIVLDCAGYNISGDYAGTGYGIYTGNKNNVTIINCTIYGFNNTDEKPGIYLESGDGSNLSLNILHDNYDGIFIIQAQIIIFSQMIYMTIIMGYMYIKILH